MLYRMSFLTKLVGNPTTLNSVRSYTVVVNVFGRRTIDTHKEAEQKVQAATIPVSAEMVGEVSSIPPEVIKEKKARIFIQAKNSMQSGTFQQRKWKIDFGNEKRWENPIMGWGSTGDAYSNLVLDFGSKEDAVIYCERMGYDYTIDEPHILNKRIKKYGDNFAWNKRTRRSCK